MTSATLQLLSANERCVIHALTTLAAENKDTTLFFDSRDIANASGLSIYQTRYILLKLCEKGVVRKGRHNPEKRQPWLWSLNQELPSSGAACSNHPQ